MPPLAFGFSKAAIERPAKPQRGAAEAFGIYPLPWPKVRAAQP